jgi:hypothetical protein
MQDELNVKVIKYVSDSNFLNKYDSQNRKQTQSGLYKLPSAINISLQNVRQ